jgi:hypothetical protein
LKNSAYQSGQPNEVYPNSVQGARLQTSLAHSG